MRKKYSFLVLVTFLMALSVTTEVQADGPVEELGRGLIVVPTTPRGEFVSWRLLATDDVNTTFDIMRDEQVIKSDLSNVTSYKDVTGSSSNVYKIITKVNGVAVDTTAAVRPWTSPFYRLHLNRPASKSDYSYSPGDCSVGDVDGDGEYELIVKWDPSNQKDNSQGGMTGNVFIDCYKIDWTQGGDGLSPQRLWRIDLGVNIRAGAHYTQFMVYDFDGDGRAEMICKTAPGSIDGQGQYVSEAGTESKIKQVDNTRDWRNSGGRTDGGYEFLTIFEGQTGKAIHTVFYKPNRNATLTGYEGSGTFDWDNRGDKTDYTSYGNRGERYLACVAHLDGIDNPAYGVFCRGYYSYAYVWAVGFDGQKLVDKWFHDSSSNNSYRVKTGASSFRIIDSASGDRPHPIKVNPSLSKVQAGRFPPCCEIIEIGMDPLPPFGSKLAITP